MSEHEQEGRELEGMMERGLAVMIAHGAALVEARAKRQQATPVPGVGEGIGPMPEQSVQAQRVQQQMRDHLAREQSDPEFWRSAPIEELVDRMKSAHDVDPTKLGNSEHDRGWARQAQSSSVIGTLSLADEFADRSEVAAAVRDNLKDQIRDFGIDPDELMLSDPDIATQKLAGVRGEDWAMFVGSEHQPVPHDRDGAQVSTLLSQAQAADKEAEFWETQAEMAEQNPAIRRDEQGREIPPWAPKEASAPAAGPAGSGLSRAERVAESSSTPAAAAAAVAARDHPTNPALAAAAPAKNSKKARAASGPGVGRERGRGM